MFLRALLAFLALPGSFAIAVPLAWIWTAGLPFHLHPLSAIGLLGLIWCTRDFYVAGKGTLAIWEPPKYLVESGLYKYSRNPMFICMSLMLLGWAIAYNQRFPWLYTLFFLAAFQLRVIYGEEPGLARRFGPAWDAYRARVPRWLRIWADTETPPAPPA
jgi:protein-S-isoprenylcysteine O-methyltransferase Ste14